MTDYIIDKNNITKDRITAIIQQFQTKDIPQLNRRWNYFVGKQKILNKLPSYDGKPCNKVVCNFVKNIVDTYTGYAMGIPVSYSNDEIDIESILDVLNYNDVNEEDNTLYRNGLIFGRSAEINFIDEEGQQRFKSVDSRSIIPVYDDTLEHNLILAIRLFSVEYSESDKNYYVDVYDDVNINHYKSEAGFNCLYEIGSEPHYFNQVPVTFFSLNTEETGVADSIFSLQDAYNTLMSDSLDDWDAFVDAYMVLKGVVADEDDMKAMKENRLIMIDADCDAEYLIKDVNTDEIQNLLKNTEQKIRELAGCPNFASEEFNTSSGIAIKFRCMELENNVAAQLNNFKKALQKRIELICSILSKVEGEDTWRDIEIIFTRNIPTDETQYAQMINSLAGIISKRTLLSIIPYVKDVDAELEELKKEQEENMQLNQMYSFNDEEDTEDDNE